MDMLEELQQYYNKVGISSLNFKCSHLEECNAGVEKFIEAKAALVGKGYQSHKLPRLLFISLDPGSSDSLRQSRTACGVREQYEQSNPLGGAKFKHWYRTHEFAYEILKAFDLNMIIDSVIGCFAHTNSCKCCVSKPHRQEANKKLFTNCKGYIPDEVRILKPDIIITQGAEALRSIKDIPKLDLKDFKFTTKWRESDYPELAVLSINDLPVLWIHTYHPSCWGSFNNHTRRRLGDYSQITYEFINNSSKLDSKPL